MPSIEDRTREGLYEKLNSETWGNKTRTRKRVLKNLRHLNDFSDKQLRIIENNRRLGLAHLTEEAFRSSEDELMSQHLFPENIILNYLSLTDPLARKIIHYLESREEIHIGAEHFLRCPEGINIAKKLLTRTMGKEEYEGYLSGKLPIGKYKGKDYYLPSEN